MFGVPVIPGRRESGVITAIFHHLTGNPIKHFQWLCIVQNSLAEQVVKPVFYKIKGVLQNGFGFPAHYIV